MKETAGSACVLMFSGGRDSTIAAARLSKSFGRLLLVTVSSGHLTGLENVRRRVAQLRTLLPQGSEWMQVAQPALPVVEPFAYRTCLPCQHAYIATGALIAKGEGIADLAMGYAGYQGAWPEQTPYATAGAARVLRKEGIRLRLPVYDLRSKEEALAELARLGLGPESLEQKCLRQESNVDLDGAALKEETDRWLASIAATIGAPDAVSPPVLRREKVV